MTRPISAIPTPELTPNQLPISSKKHPEQMSSAWWVVSHRCDSQSVSAHDGQWVTTVSNSRAPSRRAPRGDSGDTTHACLPHWSDDRVHVTPTTPYALAKYATKLSHASAAAGSPLLHA